MVQVIQWVGLLFAIVVLYITYTNYRRQEFTINEFGLWSLVALAIGTIAVMPSILDPIVETLNFARTLDFVVIVGFLFVISASLYTYLVTRRTQRMMEQIVRKMAIENREKQDKKR